MKISALPPSGMAQANAPAAAAADVRQPLQAPGIRMNVNRTPGYVPGQPMPPPPDASKLSISPLSETSAAAAVEDTQPISPQMAALAKQRRALQAERQAFEREKAERAAASQSATVPIDRLKSDPLSVLMESGVTYEQLTEAILKSPQRVSPELHALKQEIDALKEGVDKRFTETASQQEQQVLAEMRREADQLAADDAFELVRATKSVPHVMQLIERTYRETGEVLDVKEAMSLVESELEKDILQRASLKKVQAKLGQFAPQSQPQQVRGMRTLTNRDTASVPLSAKARALAAFHGQLK